MPSVSRCVVLVMTLEIPPRTELHETRWNRLQRVAVAERNADGTHAVQRNGDRVRVERVVEIEVQVHATLRQPQDLREPQVDLIQPIAPHRSWFNHVEHGGGIGEWTSQ